MKFKEIAKRLTGISTPVFGASWQPPESEVAVARRVITFLEDRRVLYSPYEMEMPSHCSQSVIEIRKYLTDEIGKASPESDLVACLRGMRSACRKFLDDTGEVSERIANRSVGGIPYVDLWIFCSALGELRGVAGIYIAKLASTFGVDVEKDLATILPGKQE